MKDFKVSIIAIYFFFQIVLYIFLSLMSSAYFGLLGGKPLPLLTENVISYSWIFPASVIIPISSALYFHHKRLKKTEHALGYLLGVFGLALFLFSMVLLALPLPFIYPISILK